MFDIYMRFPQGKKKALTFSYDDGMEQDIRLIDIMKKHGLKGTFNISTGLYAPEGMVYPEGSLYRWMTRQQATNLYTNSGMEVAVHGLHHWVLTRLSANQCTWELTKDRENLEEQFQRIVRGMAYPNCDYNDQVIACAKSAGIVYARTVEATGDFAIPQDWMRLRPTCHQGDIKLMDLAKKFVETTYMGDPWLFYIWGHSYEFECDNCWHIIENLAEYIGFKEDIWYATNMEIYEYIEAYRSLVFTMDSRRVYNPSAFELWLEYEEKLYCVKPGEEMFIMSGTPK